MPAPYSSDLRRRALLAYKHGEGSQSVIAKRFDISESTLKRYWQRDKQRGHCDAILGNKGRKSVITEKDSESIKRLVARYPTATLHELVAHYNKPRKKKVHWMTLHRALKRLNIRRKKLSHYAQARDRADVQKARDEFKKK